MAKGSNNSSGRRSSSRNTKPYDANNSFVKKVATKVTDFIPQRSWISKWFNSSQNEEDVLDDSENHEEVESEDDIQKPPPSKRPCIRMDVTHPPGTFSIQPRAKPTIDAGSPSKQQYSIHNETSDDFSKPVMAGPSGMSHLISSTPAAQSDIRNITSQRSELNSLIATTNNGTTNGMDDHSESSESTSGCSSLIPQTNRQEAPSNVSYNSPFPTRKRFHDDKLSFTNHMQSPRSLFLDNTTRDTLSNRRPSFNASIMTNTPDRATPLASPFYTGNTTFGGANAAGLYKRGRNLFNSANEIQLKVPKRTSVEVKPPNAAGVDSSGMSQTAKKILEALEHFSSPITDAKKIPLKMMNNTSLMNKKRSREEGSPSTTKIGLRHLTRELTVPTVPDILKLKRRQKLQDTTAAARKIVSARSEAPPPQEYRIRTQDNEDSKRHGKVKAKAADLEEEETVEPVNLPNIPLPISSLPNFNFMQPINSKAADKRGEDKEEIFTFASPIKVTSVTKALKSINNFTFSSPINTEKQSTDISHQSAAKISTCKPSIISSEYVSSPVAQNFMWTRSSTAPRPKEKVKGSESTMPPIPKELKSGSVMDILGSKSNTTDPEKSSESKMQLNLNKEPANHKTNILASNVDDNVVQFVNSESSIQQNTSTTWECSECLFKNINSETVCFACKVAKPSLKNKKTFELSSAPSNVSETKTTVNDNFGPQFKLSTHQWECTVCFVRNKHTDTKCVACNALKSGTNLEVKSNAVKSEMSDAVRDTPSKKSWECSKCNLKNSENSSTCLSCNTSKSTLSKTSSQEENNLSINTNASKNEAMDKFKTSKDTWECPCCMVRNAASTDTCPCCNTAKPNAGVVTKSTSSLLPNGFGDKFKKPEGSWNCDTCMVQNEGKVTECVACGGLKPGSKKADNSTNTTSPSLQFSFGIPANAGSFKFGIDKAGPENTDTTVSTNGFKFGDTQQSSQPGQFTFGIQKEEKKTLNDESKSDNNTLTTTGSSFVFQTSTSNGEKTNINQDSEKTEKKMTPVFTFGMPKSENVTPKSDKESVNTTVPTALSSPFTFGASKGNISTSVTKVEKEGSFMGNPSAEVPESATITTTTTAITSVSTLPSMTQSTSQEIKPAATFSFGATSSIATIPNSTSSTAVSSLPSSTQSSFIFVESKSTTQTAPVPTFGPINTTAPTSNLTNTFTFGENKATDGSSAPKTFGVLSNAPSGGSLFSSISNAPSLFSNNDTKTAQNFGQPSTEGNKQPAFGTGTTKPSTFTMAENKVPSFSSPEIKPSIFGSSDTKMPVFGSADNKTTSLFNPTPQVPASATPAPASFGAPSATSTLFGTSITPVFGNNTAPTFTTESTPNIFGSTTSKPNEATSTPSSNLFTFGTTPAQPVAQPATGFNFSGNASSTEPTQKPLFTFGSSSSSSQSGNLFGNSFSNPTPTNSSAFTFNSPKPEATAFAQPAALSPIFGAPQPAAQNQASSSFPTAPINTGFNFGSAAPATSSGGFNFGAAPTSAPSTGFNFNSSNTTLTFDPNSPPSFNFTGGNAPMAFSGTPAAVPPRKFKKACRRMR